MLIPMKDLSGYALTARLLGYSKRKLTSSGYPVKATHTLLKESSDRIYSGYKVGIDTLLPYPGENES